MMRDFASRITKIALQNAMGAETAKNVSAFRAFRANLRGAFERYSGPYVSIDVLLTWSTQRFSAIPVANRPRSGGVSGYTTRKLITHAMNMLTGFSTLPLQIGSVVGFILTVFGVAILALVTIRYFLYGGVVPGFSFLASIISIFSGAQLFALGIFGEYLARVHTRTMDKPPYAVRAATDGTWLARKNLAPCQALDWDSAFFGFRIARLLQGHLTTQILSDVFGMVQLRKGYRCLYFWHLETRVKQRNWPETNGFRMADVRITLARELRG